MEFSPIQKAVAIIILTVLYVTTRPAQPRVVMIDLWDSNESRPSPFERRDAPTYIRRGLNTETENNSTLPDPDSFGWTPEVYPDPIQDPVQCGISNLSLGSNFSNETELICDPDHVYNHYDKQMLALALRNFSETFSDVSTRRLSSNQHGGFGSAIVGFWDNMMTRIFGNSTHVQKSRSSKPTTASNNYPPPYEVGIATIEKINLQSVLQQGYYYTYQDQSQMINDAAQIFSHVVHDNWWSEANVDCLNDGETQCPSPAYGILIFLSVQDHVCFISTGSATTYLLPWWRLGNVVWSMKDDLMKKHFGKAMIAGIRELTVMLQSGPPSMQSRVRDFLSRFGVVLGFAIVTFLFGAWGEYRDRRKRWQYAERRSNMSPVEREKARHLQREFKTKACPICLENFVDESNVGSPSAFGVFRRVDSFGIPLRGNDDKPIKMLRCGHIFDETCWRQWVNSGQGNPCICPVCRQDVGRTKPPQEQNEESSPPPPPTTPANRPGVSEGYSDIPLFGRNRLLALRLSRRNEGGGLRRNNRTSNTDENDDLEPGETDRLLPPSQVASARLQSASERDSLLNPY